MSCKHPLKGFQVGVNPSGKPKYLIAAFATHHVEIHEKFTVACDSSKVSPYANRVVKDYIEIPCGKCIACRIAYSRQWADRMIAEVPYHESSYFVTLTYDDDNLPLNDFIDPETGLIGTRTTLVKTDVSSFMKNLRRQLDYHFPDHPRISYYAAGEYGSSTARPHYHLIIFGLQLNDLKLYKKSSLGFNYYNSEFLQKIWKKGYVVVADVSWQSAAYVARYVLKKQTGSNAEIYKRFNFQQEFSLMSRRPSIGRRFYEEHKSELYEFDYVSVATAEGGRQIRPNRYFDRLMEMDDESFMAEVKNRRKDYAKTLQELKLSRTDKSYLELLETEEENLLAKISMLPRKEI